MFSSIFNKHSSPKTFNLLLSEVKNNKITELVLNEALFDKFGSILYKKANKSLEEALVKLKIALIKNTSIHTLNFHGIALPTQIIHVIEALFQNKNIKKIYLNCSVALHNQFYDKWAKILEVNNSIEYLFIHFASVSANDYFPKILQALHSNTGLKVLAINRTHTLYDETITAFAELPLHNNTLKKVEIYCVEALLKVEDQPIKTLLNPAYLKKEIYLKQNTYFSKLPRELITHLEKFIQSDKTAEFKI